MTILYTISNGLIASAYLPGAAVLVGLIVWQIKGNLWFSKQHRFRSMLDTCAVIGATESVLGGLFAIAGWLAS